MSGQVYRQLTQRLRIHRPGEPDKVSERPRDARSGRFLDADKPTLVVIDEKDVVNVSELIRTGAIEPWEPPKGKQQRGETAVLPAMEVRNGEGQ